MHSLLQLLRIFERNAKKSDLSIVKGLEGGGRRLLSTSLWKFHISYKDFWDVPPSTEPIKQLCACPHTLCKCISSLVNKLFRVYLCLIDATNMS